MNHPLRLIPMMLIPGLFLASCGSMAPSTAVRDDVYYMPSTAPPVASTRSQAGAEPSGTRSDVQEDYYDPGTAEQFDDRRTYYDMAYNDPYYYNYGRFGFGANMGMGMGMGGWQTGWAGPGWGMGWGMGPSMGMGMGWGMGPSWVGMGMYDHWNLPLGWNPSWGWNRPIGMGWNSPYGWHDPYMGGYGYGNYFGPGGSCFSCYTPVVIGGGSPSNTIVGHRPSMSGSGAGNTGSGGNVQPRMIVRDPVGLNRDQLGTGRSSLPSGTRPARGVDRTPQPALGRDRSSSPQRQVIPRGSRTEPSRGFDRGGSIDRGGAGGFDRGGSSPGGGGSRSIGGGGRPR